ncbi:nucleotidyl transferase AbiEii/AbiGii toxin family protein [Fusobacterium animalis]|nr:MULTISPECIES: nucleotidyl transferase AbiEii/AbiGii toxin family protein [Fusobacterium]
MIGIKSRTTLDMDLLLKNIQLSKEKMFEVLNEALKNNLNDEISYEIQNISPIREEDKYGGVRIKILCKFDNIKVVVPLDIATGDIVTPYPIDYNYTSVFSDEKILIKAYSIETMIAEKLQTIYMRGFLNSRSKDYYDLYILYKLKIDEINFNTLLEACEKTFCYRKTDFDLNKLKNLLKKLKEDKSFLKQWRNYKKKNNYVGDINFENVIDNILKIIEKIESKK